MKSIWTAILLAVSISWAQANLDEILAPLPEPESVTETKSEKPKKVASEEIPQSKSATENVSPITSEDLIAKLEEALHERLRPSGELALSALREMPDLSKYAKPFEVKLLSIPSMLKRNENFLLTFNIENDKGILGQWAIPFSARVFSDVWFINAHLSEGDVATPSDFEVRRVDLVHQSDAVPANLETLLRHEYSRDIRPGKPLVWADLTERSLVRDGDYVEVIASRGLLAITMRALARSSGAKGDVVVLRNLESGKEFSGRVAGENRVEVAF